MNTCCRAAVMLWLSTIGLLFGASTPIAPAFAGDPWGTWYTKDNERQIRITNCGGALCGSLVWLQEPNNPTNGEPLTDRHNPDPNKQSRPLLDTQIVLGMRPSGPDQWSGYLYNAEDGKTYSGSFIMTGASTAEVKGCLLIFCQSQTWTRQHGRRPSLPSDRASNYPEQSRAWHGRHQTNRFARCQTGLWSEVLQVAYRIGCRSFDAGTLEISHKSSDPTRN